MVVFQFTISILLAIGTLTIFQQIEHMKNQYPGFDKEQKLVIPFRGSTEVRDHYQSVKGELRDHHAVSGVTFTSHVPGRGVSNFSIALVGEADRKNQGMYHMYVDEDFITDYNIEMIAGRSYKLEMRTDVSDWERAGGFLMNEAAVAAFGWHLPEDAVGKQLLTGLSGREGPVIGVVKNFHFKGLQSAVEPLIIEFFPDRFRYITLTIKTDDLSDVMAYVTGFWSKIFPGAPMQSYFLDEDFDSLYRSEEQLGKVAGAFTIMGLCIACLGLLGLASIMAEQRTKEIGIRKVLGASAPKVVMMLSKKFAKWVFIANVLAWPLAWFGMNSWLETFAVHTGMNIWVLVASGLGALVVALITVSYRSFKAALTNPVNTLRYE